MDDDIQEGDDPAEAFDRLRAVIEGQDRELALLRRAVEGLAAERAHIDVPDYSETLGRMQQGVDATAERIAVINDVIARSPALAMTPEQMAQRIAAAGNAARREDQAALAKGGRGQGPRHGRASQPSRVRMDAGRPEEPAAMVRSGRGGDRHSCMVDPARPRRARDRAGELAMARAHGGAHARPGPLGGGQRMMQSASPTAFRAIAGADRIVTANRETVEGCSKVAARKRETVRCTIRIAPAP